MNALAGILRVRPGEGRLVASVVGLLFVASAGLTIGESGVNALFFERIGPDALPVMYLAQGATGLVAMLVLTGSLARFDRRRAYVVMPAILAAVVVIERAIVATDVDWIYRVLRLAVAVAILVQSVYLLGAAGAVTDISVAMTAPNKTGTIRGNWRMSTASGQFFGDEVYVQVVIGGGAAATSTSGPATSSTSTPAPPTSTSTTQTP